MPGCFRGNNGVIQQGMPHESNVSTFNDFQSRGGLEMAMNDAERTCGEDETSVVDKTQGS